MNNFFDLKLDSPVGEDGIKDKLEYGKIYVEPIYEILEANKYKKLAFGIFGNYGSGKSSVIKLLEEKYKNYEKDITFVNISVWGHSSIAIIRKILIEISRKVNSKKNHSEFYQSFFYDKEEIDTKRFKKHLNNLKLILILLFIGILASICFVLFLSLFLNTKKLPSNIADNFIALFSLTSCIITMGIGYFGYKYGFETLGKRFIKRPLTLDEFKIKFEDLLKRSSYLPERLIIVIDDLDRCKKEVIINTLEKLDSLLKYKENEVNIKKIKIQIILPFSLTDYQNNKTPEFEDIYKNARKFLDTYIWLPNQSELELYRMTIEEKDE